MTFQWLNMRIQEEKDRRKREAMILERLPRALEEVNHSLEACIEGYTQAFGPESADLLSLGSRLKVTVREQRDGKWQPSSKIEITLVPAIPGFQIERGEHSLIVEVGMLPGDKVFYRDREQDQYLTVEELTRRILDRAFFPKLGE